MSVLRKSLPRMHLLLTPAPKYENKTKTQNHDKYIDHLWLIRHGPNKLLPRENYPEPRDR